MIQKGIIETIISPFEYKVRIPRYDKLSTTPDGTSTEDLSSAIVCSTPGTKLAYKEQDIVLIGFENNELNKPVILGLLYREDIGETNQFNLPTVEKALSEYKQELEELSNNKLYTHIKYSNDNGVTFTSLYEYTDTIDVVTDQLSYVTATDIKIDPKSTTIYWSIIDNNNVDIASEFNITTTLYATDLDGKLISESFTDSLIKIPIRFKHLDSLTISFRILRIRDFDNYHIVLTTDRDTIGSVYGDYMGICISTNPIPSTKVADYSWTSFYDTISYLVNKLENSLLPRVERNEQALYGYTYSSDNQVSDDTGLLDGMRVTEDEIHIHGVNNKNIIFNTSETMFIDNEHDNLTIKDLEHTNVSSDNVFSDFYNENEHLTLLVRKKVY